MMTMLGSYETHEAHVRQAGRFEAFNRGELAEEAGERRPFAEKLGGER